MTAEQDVRARVEAFVRDYHERWSRAGSTEMPPVGDFEAMQSWMMNQFVAGGFDRWDAEVAELEAAHGTPSLATHASGAISAHPDHDPSTEEIHTLEVDGRRAMVRSSMPGHVEQHYEYQLLLVDDDWRIDKLVKSLTSPGEPIMEPAAADALLSSARDDAPLPPVSEHVGLDVPLLFKPKRKVRLFDDERTTGVTWLGDLTTTSGVLAALDLGWARFTTSVLARRVPPGTYRVEVATAGATNVALRLVLTDHRVAEHRVALFTDGTHEVSVDAGNVALSDAAALLSAASQQVEAVFQEQAQNLVDGHPVAFGLGGGAVDTVMVSSGFGDGGYPCYWGVDAAGDPVELVVDFLVLAEDVTRTSTAPFGPGEWLGCTVAQDGDSYDISHPSDRHLEWRVLGPDGAVLTQSGNLGSFVSGGVSSSTWQAAQVPEGSVLEVTEHLGYRHV